MSPSGAVRAGVLPLPPGVYWRLSGFYLGYFAAAGALFPYLGLYLAERGFAPSAIGGVFAALTALKLVAPYAWAALADRRDAAAGVVRFTTTAAALAFAGLLLEPAGGWLVGLLLLYSAFSNGTLPQFEALTMRHLRDAEARYTHVRLWGSVGFIGSVAGLGWYLEHAPIAVLPAVVVVLLAAAAATALALPAAPRGDPGAPAAGVRTALAAPAVLAFLAAGLLMQASHGAYYTFYSIYLDEAGYGRGVIRLLWALGVVSEILLFFFMHRVLERWQPRTVLLGCFALTALRWALLAGWVDAPAAVLLAQPLHAVSYGAFHAASILAVNRYFPGRMRGRGQALYASVSFGLGGGLGSLGAGFLWEAYGGPGAFAAAGVVCALAGGIVARWMR